jgi:hypothetical protein
MGLTKYRPDGGLTTMESVVLQAQHNESVSHVHGQQREPSDRSFSGAPSR